MIARAIARFIRISPRKTRLVADMVRGKGIDEAQAVLTNLEKRARIYISQLLKSAVANAAVKDPDISPGDLYISKLTIDNGPMFKRYRAGSMGRAMMIRHRTSHILLEIDKKPERLPAPQRPSAPIKEESKRVRKYESKKVEKKTAKEAMKAKAKKLVAAKKG